MEFVDILFSDFIPDRAGAPWPENPGYLVDADGARPTGNGWTPSVDATAVGTSFAGATVVSAFCDASEERIVVGTSKELWQTNNKGTSWSDVKQATYSASYWSFAQFDNRLVAATYGIAYPQTKDLATTVGTPFSDLSGLGSTAGAGAHVVARVRDHLVLGGGTMDVPNAVRAVRWSSIGDPTDYPALGSATALSRQAGAQALSGYYGAVTGIVGHEKYGLVFQERAITRMTYVGGNVVYQFDRIEQFRGSGHTEPITGARGPQAFVTVNGITYFPNRAGIFATDGYRVRCISGDKVGRSLFLNDSSHPEAIGTIIDCALDPYRSSIYFLSAPNTANGVSDRRILAYDYEKESFYFLANQTALAFLGTTPNASTGQGVDGLNSAWSVAGTTLRRFEAVPASVDLQTGFIELAPGKRVQLHGAHILGSGTTTPTIGFKGVDTPNSVSPVQTGFTSMTAAARDIRQTARDTNRYFAFRVTGAQGAGALINGLRVYFTEAQAA